MPVVSPVSDRTTIACLLLLTFSTGIVDAISVLVLGHVFVANMTGNIILLGFWFAPPTAVDLTMCAGALLGATLTRWFVAPVIAVSAAVVAVAAGVFRFGPNPVA